MNPANIASSWLHPLQPLRDHAEPGGLRLLVERPQVVALHLEALEGAGGEALPAAHHAGGDAPVAAAIERGAGEPEGRITCRRLPFHT